MKDLKAKTYLFKAIDRSILGTILSKETSKDIWNSMKKKYQGSYRVTHAQPQALKENLKIYKQEMVLVQFSDEFEYVSFEDRKCLALFDVFDLV